MAYVFTENEEVALAFANMSPFLAVSVLLNSIQPVLSGTPFTFVFVRNIRGFVLYFIMKKYTLVSYIGGISVRYK